MRQENQEQRKQGRFEFPGALDDGVMPEGAKREVQADEVRGPPASLEAARPAEAKVGESSLDPHRQVSTSAEQLAEWRREAQKTLSVLKAEQERLESASRQFGEGGWSAVTSLSAEEKLEFRLQVERDLAAGRLPIPKFVPSYLSPNIKRLEDRVQELGTLRPADEGRDSAVLKDDAAPPLEEPSSNAYEQKLEARRERLEDAAAKAHERSGQQYQRAKELTEHIPLGQPIILGHHSEKRHRAEIKRSHRAMDRFVEEANRAKELERRAKRVGTGGVSADDPAAAQKLQARLEKMEERREFIPPYSRGEGWRPTDPGLSREGTTPSNRATRISPDIQWVTPTVPPSTPVSTDLSRLKDDPRSSPATPGSCCSARWTSGSG